MTTPTPPKTTLREITTKVRRLTGRPSQQHITDVQIWEYINTFYLYDFPETLRVFSNKGIFKFVTIPNVDRYKMIADDPNNPKFNELVVNVNGTNMSAASVYYNLKEVFHVSGYHGSYYQDREQFLIAYPMPRAEDTIRGNGSATYETTLKRLPILPGSVAFGNISEQYIDIPQNRTQGYFKALQDNQASEQTGTIDYLTGRLQMRFKQAVSSRDEITITSSVYKASRPYAMLFYDNEIILRYPPDRAYQIEIEAFRTPVAFLSEDSSPLLKQWWQYIAFGAAKKIFEDSGDSEGVQSILPAFKEQESLVLNRHIVQQKTQRSKTIYSEGNRVPLGGRFFNSFF